MSGDLETYYRRRAHEYDEVYRKPERQDDIARLGDLLRGLVEGRRTLEIAAGTGFWTARVAPSVASILATDVADEVLEIARTRSYISAEVAFALCDAFSLDEVPGSFDAGLACFWLSHLERHRMVPFLRHLGSRLEPGGRVVLADNRFVEGSNHPITRIDDRGNSYQRRVLSSGEEFEVLKNIPTVDEL